MYDGAGVWSKFGEIKKYCNNTIGPIYKSMPMASGMQLQDHKDAVRQALYTQINKEGILASKDPDKAPPDWEPSEWMTFWEIGPPAKELCMGPFELEGEDDNYQPNSAESGAEGESGTEPNPGKLSRKEQRKQMVLAVREQSKKARTDTTMDRLDAMNKVQQETAARQQEAIAHNTAAMQRQNQLQQRKDRIEELKLLVNLSQDPTIKAKAWSELENLLMNPV